MSCFFLQVSEIHTKGVNSAIGGPGKRHRFTFRADSDVEADKSGHE